MGSEFHTFQVHSHGWIIPGPHRWNVDPNTHALADADTDAIQRSPLDTLVSQFEDTRTFGPANSFVFTIDEGKGFMRADP